MEITKDNFDAVLPENYKLVYIGELAELQGQINNQLVTQGREVVQEQNALASEEKVLSELEKEPMIEPETVHITFMVAECGEFHTMGEFHEGIETIEEAKIQTLAAELDQLSQDIDPYGYADTVSDREAQVLMIADDIRNGNIEPPWDFLQTAIEEEKKERQEWRKNFSVPAVFYNS